MDRRRAQKTKSEHEHASENAPEKKQENMRNGGRKVQKFDEKCSPEEARRVQNGCLEACRALLGAMCPQSGRQERSKWLRGATRGAPKIRQVGPGPSQKRNVHRCQGHRGGPRRLRGGLWGAILGAFFDHAAWGTNKTT